MVKFIKWEKQLLLTDLSVRLPYGINVLYNKINCVIENIGRDGSISLISNDDTHKKAIYLTSIEYIKPYLRPMSSMTEEEVKEIAILYGIKDILSVKVTNDYIAVVVDDGVCSTEIRTIWYDEIISSIEIFDYLNKHHIDYRGLIPMGLALEASNGMYNN